MFCRGYMARPYTEPLTLKTRGDSPVNFFRMDVRTLLLWATVPAAQTAPSGKGAYVATTEGLICGWKDRIRLDRSIRREVLSQDADAKRELMVYAWYSTEHRSVFSHMALVCGTPWSSGCRPTS